MQQGGQTPWLFRKSNRVFLDNLGKPYQGHIIPEPLRQMTPEETE